MIRRRYCIECCVIDNIPDHAPNELSKDSVTSATGKLSNLSITPTYDTRIAVPSKTASGGTTKPVPLQLDDGTRRYPQPLPETSTPSTSSTVSTAPKTPNIYLEENDPDFYNNDDDYDEDEPDDDLDL